MPHEPVIPRHGWDAADYKNNARVPLACWCTVRSGAQGRISCCALQRWRTKLCEQHSGAGSLQAARAGLFNLPMLQRAPVSMVSTPAVKPYIVMLG